MDLFFSLNAGASAFYSRNTRIQTAITRVSRAFSCAHLPKRSIKLHLSAHDSRAPTATTSQPSTFMDELRSYAMRLHTKEQAPREGQAAAPKEKQEWKPTTEGYLRFLIESQVVYNAFEGIMATVPEYKAFINTGLERSQALSKDIAYMTEHFSLQSTPASSDGPGALYADFLRKLAIESPPAFICHYYNFYFAHTAGGRMIGAQVSKAALDGWMGEFYKWDGDVRQLLGNVRDSLNIMAEGWSREEKDRCLEETPSTFQFSGSLLKLIGGGGGGH